jgi:DNA-binding PadR family transcriptional regulator
MPARSVSFRHFILGLLTQEPMSGYDIKRALQRLGWLVGDPSFGSLYPALHALLSDGLVEVDVFPRQDKPPRKVYSIMEAGRQELAAWTAQPQAPNSSLKAFVMRLNLAGSLSSAGLVAHLEQRRAQVDAHRADLEHGAESVAEHVDLGQSLALNYGLALARAELDWLDSTLDRLSQPAPDLEMVPRHSPPP